MIAYLGKKFTIKAQQILDLPIRKRKSRKRWKNRHRAQRKLRKSGKKGIVRNANCAIAHLAQIAQLAKLANYFAQRPPLHISNKKLSLDEPPLRKIPSYGPALLLSRSGSLPYCFWNMLLNAFLKPLGCATYVRTNGSGLYFAKKNRFVQAKAVCIYPSIVSIRSLPLSKDRLHFSLPLIVQSS